MNKYDFSEINLALASFNLALVGINVYWGLHIGLPYCLLSFTAVAVSLYMAHYCVRK